MSKPRVFDAMLRLTDKLSAPLQKAAKNIDEFENHYDKVGRAMRRQGRNFERMGSTLTKSITLPVAAALGASVKQAVDFETAWAGVKKTVDGTPEQMAKLQKGIRNMAKEIPASHAEISAVAEAAGQLGIEIPNILDFTKVMIDLGESTNLSAEEAATNFARFANITGMSQKDFDKLGSVVVDLGNNLATTESEIVAMSMRLAGAGAQIGLSEAQIMSFAGALSSVGIEAQAGGTAFSKVMVRMQLAAEMGGKKLDEFGAVAGMSGAQFKEAFEKDAAKAMMTFIEGLGNAEQRGVSSIRILDEMGLKEERLRDALLRSSNASEVFSRALGIGNKAWDENTALTDEAAQRYKTMASRMQVLKNRFLDTAITVGEKLLPHVEKAMDKIGDLIDWFDSLDPAMQDNIIKWAMMAAAIGPPLQLFGKFLGIGGNLLGNIVKLKSNLGDFATILGFATSPANLFLLKIAAIAALVGGLILLFKNWGKVVDWVSDRFPRLGKLMDGIGKVGGKFFGGIKNIFTKGKDVNVSDRMPDPQSIPSFSKGTRFFKGGFAQVHEKGGEIIDLPRGTRIMPHDESVQTAYKMGSERKALDTEKIVIEKLADMLVVREEADIDKIIDGLYKKLKFAKMNSINKKAVQGV